ADLFRIIEIDARIPSACYHPANNEKNKQEAARSAMENTVHTKVLIIGSGPAGYMAGTYAARAGLEPTLVAGLQPGGQLTITTDVENFPGFESIKGPELMDKMRAQAEHAGTTMIDDIIKSVDLSQRPFRAEGESGTVYTADSVIIATGAKARWLGLESEARL